MYGPTPFHLQPAEVRALGRKGLAGMTKKERAARYAEWAAARGGAPYGGVLYRKRDAYGRFVSSGGGGRKRRKKGGRRRAAGRLSWIFDRSYRPRKGRKRRTRACNTAGSRQISKLLRSGELTKKQARRARKAMYRQRGASRRLSLKACRAMGRAYGRYY